MNLQTAISIYCGGPGSGRHPYSTNPNLPAVQKKIQRFEQKGYARTGMKHDKFGYGVLNVIETLERENKVNAKANQFNTFQNIPLAKMYATQPDLRSHALAGIAKTENIDKVMNDTKTPPHVTRYKGNYYVIDGHHRLSVLHWLGEKTARVRVLDLKKFSDKAGVSIVGVR